MKIILFLLVALLIFSCSDQKAKTKTAEPFKVNYLVGQAEINQSAAKIGDVLSGKSNIKTGPESILEIKQNPQTGLRVKPESELVLTFNGDKIEVEVIRGGVLNIVKKGQNYRLVSPAAVAAVRGTVFYTYVFGADTTYMCTCNGSIDYFDGDRLIRNVTHDHHEAYNFIKSEQEVSLQQKGMFDHSDQEIEEFLEKLKAD